MGDEVSWASCRSAPHTRWAWCPWVCMEEPFGASCLHPLEAHSCSVLQLSLQPGGCRASGCEPCNHCSLILNCPSSARIVNFHFIHLPLWVSPDSLRIAWSRMGVWIFEGACLLVRCQH